MRFYHVSILQTRSKPTEQEQRIFCIEHRDGLPGFFGEMDAIEQEQQNLPEEIVRRNRTVAGSITKFNKKNKERGSALIVDYDAAETVMLLKEDSQNPEAFAEEFYDAVKIPYSGNLSVEECTFVKFWEHCEQAAEQCFLKDPENFIRQNGLQADSLLGGYRHHLYKEDVVNDVDCAKKLKKASLCSMFRQEIERIRTGKTQDKFLGNVAHYVIFSEDEEHTQEMIDMLITSLYEKRRLLSTRYAEISTHFEYDEDVVNSVYAMNEGATVVIRMTEDGNAIHRNIRRQLLSEEDEDVSMPEFIPSVRKHCLQTLSVIVVKDSKSYKAICEQLNGVTLVKINENTFSAGESEDFLSKCAENDGRTADASLTAKVKNEDRYFTRGELLDIYHLWAHEQLCKNMYPEYADCVCGTETEVVAKKGDPYKELLEMVGLDNVKRTIQGILNYFRLQKVYDDRKLNYLRPCMNMSFTGNPGTAKTSVARLLSKILYQNKITKREELVEVGRADLVGKYVGHTAVRVRKVFEKAKGGVLFIDEAYSLVDDHKGMYGDEAINTIVQEMENNREDTIVIFAGYKQEMEDFLNRNPGLQSRIAFHVPFEDYSEEELYQITDLLARKGGYTLGCGAHETLCDIFDRAKRTNGFGNGRFSRNLFEKAKMNQANRLADVDLSELSDQELLTLSVEDFADVNVPEKETIRIVGFGV